MNNLVEIESVEQVTEAEEVQKKKKQRGRERELNFLYFTNLIMID
jgi:hypothetical protein